DSSLKERARNAGIRLVATYGMAETCGGCVYDGLPLDGVGLALSKDGRVRLAGPTLFDGYLDDPVATHEVLVDGWFHTSDAGRLCARSRRPLGEGVLDPADDAFPRHHRPGGRLARGRGRVGRVESVPRVPARGRRAMAAVCGGGGGGRLTRARARLGAGERH